MNTKIIFIALFGIILVSNVFATFNFNNYKIQTNYTGGDKIKGTINISFDDESAESIFSTNFNGNISLLELLELNNLAIGEDYNCTTSGCNKDYVSQNPINQISLDGEGIVGLEIFGQDITNIESIKFNVAGSSGDSCIPPLFIDFLDNPNNTIVSSKYTNVDSCFSANYGCFDNSLGNHQYVTITNNPYCEKVSLPAAPAYKIGAGIKNSTNGKSANLSAQLYDLDGVFIKECSLPFHTSDEENLECVIEHTSPKQREYLICISGDNIGNNGPDYKIKSETQGQVCGTDNLGSSYNRDYQIFAKTMRFAQPDFEVNDSLFQSIYGESLNSYVFDYIIENYDAECNPSCIIPVILRGLDQNIAFSDVLIEYRDGNTLVSDDSIYSIAEEEPKINSDNLILDIGVANFIIPTNSTSTYLELLLDGERVFRENIKITKGFSFDVNPKFVAFGQAVNFVITSSRNITKSTWDFGDGEIESVNGGRISHTYLDEGDFILKIDAEDKNGTKSHSEFTITVGNAMDSARVTIDDYKERIDNIKRVILAYPSWIQTSIDENLALNEKETSLENLESRYDDAQNESDYIEIMIELLELKIPYSINSSVKGILPLTATENIDTSYINELSLEKAENSQALEDAIFGWMNDNIESQVEFDTISGFYGGETEAILTQFKIDITPKQGAENSYLIIGVDIEDINFKSNYNEKLIEDGTYIPISSDRRVIEFSIIGEARLDDIGAYVSPAIERFELDTGEIVDYEEPGFRWGLFITGIIIILIIAFIVYIILQEWYKRNYERSLFKNEESLYNLINFINNARKSGVSEAHIKSKLKQNGWSGEQVTYAVRKLEGKRTGMFEIPIFKFIEKKKVREEIEKRGGDTTFIKEPKF